MTDLIIVGGFLGAGKTTLLWTLARKLSKKGKKVGLITNDQASELVDTVFLESSGGVVKEVSGSCFCCNFNGFAAAIEQCVQSDTVDVIIAEPVGSCTDLSATIMQPLKEKYADLVKIHPLNVLADAKKIGKIVNGENLDIHDSSMYIYKKQLEEADYIVVNKTEELNEAQKAELKKAVSNYFTKKNVFLISALMETGIDEWMEPMLADRQVGVHMAEVDYDIYAEGEAVLGWLNATISLNKETLSVKGEDIIADEAVMTLNARAEGTPQQLEKIVCAAIEEQCPQGTVCTISELNCLQPGRPEPTYRYETVYNR